MVEMMPLLLLQLNDIHTEVEMDTHSTADVIEIWTAYYYHSAAAVVHAVVVNAVVVSTWRWCMARYALVVP